MKRIFMILMILVLASLIFVACNTGEPNQQMPDKIEPEPLNNSKSISLPKFLNDTGKTLNALRNEHPGYETSILFAPTGEAAACLGKPAGKYAYYFIGGHDGDLEYAMFEHEEQLKCAGFLTTAGVLFPEMEDEMSFTDFFLFIGVSDYEYGEEEGGFQGCLAFEYHNMDVSMNANEVIEGQGRTFTGAKIVKNSTPVMITDREIAEYNDELAHAAIFR